MTAPEPADLITRIDACLPQTQCTRCGYPRCRAYAEALAAGRADLNQCPPGGEVTIAALAALLGHAAKPLNPANGAPAPRTRARIDEAVCIGCRKCLDVCPVDAIVGSRKLLHTVIAAECTGCGLCLPPCPVDCIALVAAPTTGDVWPEYTRAETEHWRARTGARVARLGRRARARLPTRRSAFPDSATIRADLHAALQRARHKRAPRP